MGADIDSSTHLKNFKNTYRYTTLSQPTLQKTHRCPAPGVKSHLSRQLSHMTESNSHRTLSCLYGSPAELNRKQLSNAVWQEYSNTHSPLQQNTIDNPMISQRFMQHSAHYSMKDSPWNTICPVKVNLCHLWLCGYLVKYMIIGIGCVQGSQKQCDE